MSAKDTDYRFTTNETFNHIKELTGVDWKNAFDPTPVNHKVDTLNKDWNASKIFLNPPFSLSHKFVPKLFNELDRSNNIKQALIILPWYQVESIRKRVVNSPRWSRVLLKNSPKYDIIKHHLGNSTFRRPDKKEVLVRVYAIHIKRKN